jgi:hypothetical protein
LQRQIEPSLSLEVARKRSRPGSLLLFLEAFSAFAGYLGGIPLIIAPSGALLNLPQSLLADLPVHLSDFFFVGVWLTLGLGLGFSVITYLLWKEKPHSWYVALGMCLIWLGQISAEMYYFGPNWVDEVWYLPQAAALILLIATRREFLHTRLSGKTLTLTGVA